MGKTLPPLFLASWCDGEVQRSSKYGEMGRTRKTNSYKIIVNVHQRRRRPLPEQIQTVL
jgi:hypothetical protein